MALAALTGCAAELIGGRTLHSCLQMGVVTKVGRQGLPSCWLQLLLRACCLPSQAALLPPDGNDSGSVELDARHCRVQAVGCKFGTSKECMLARHPTT